MAESNSPISLLRRVYFGFATVTISLLISVGIGMSGLVNIRAALWCLALAALLLVSLLWTWEHFSRINTRWKPIIGCLGSQLIGIMLLLLVRTILISAASRETAEEKHREELMDQAAGGHGYCYFVIVNNGPPWPLAVMNPGKVALLDVSVYVRQIPSPQDTPRELERKLDNPLKLNLGTVHPGGKTLEVFINPPQSVEINILTRRDRFVERLWVTTSKKNPIFLNERLEMYHSGDMRLLYKCCPEVTYH